MKHTADNPDSRFGGTTRVGDLLKIGNDTYRVTSVDSSTSVTIQPYRWWAPLAWAFVIGLVLGYVLSVLWSLGRG